MCCVCLLVVDRLVSVDCLIAVGHGGVMITYQRVVDIRVIREIE